MVRTPILNICKNIFGIKIFISMTILTIQCKMKSILISTTLLTNNLKSSIL